MSSEVEKLIGTLDWDDEIVPVRTFETLKRLCLELERQRDSATWQAYPSPKEVEESIADDNAELAKIARGE